MKEWLKFIGLSFFSDNIARQAPRRGLGNVFLTAIIAVTIMLLGLIAAQTLTFSANYGNAPEFSATVERALSEDGAALEVKGGVLYSDRIIDTVASETDRQSYSRGYDIIVDTRKAGTFDEFSAYCVSKSGKQITYEEYLEMDADMKTLYTFEIKYSGVERVIDGEWVNKCEAFLDGRTDEATVKAYADVKNKTGDEYNSALYELYVRTYYPSLTAYESDGGAPKTRNFYFHNYGDRENILFVFCDSMLGSFKTKTGAKHTFYGHYGKLSDGSIGTDAVAAKDFITKSFKGATAITVYNGVIGFFSVAPFIVLVAVAVSVALFCFTKLLKTEELKFGAAAKTVCSFFIWSALITALSVFALGFLVSQSLLAWLDGVIFFAVLMIRTAVMIIRAYIERKREMKGASDNESGSPEKAEEIGNDSVRG